MTTFFDQTVLKFTSATTIAQNIPADDFTVTSTVLASGATLRLVDGSQVKNDKLDNFSGRLNWAIYADNGGSPGAVIASGNGTHVVETSDHLASGNRDICTVSFDFGQAVKLTAGTYWFSIDEGNQGEAYDNSDPYIIDAAGNGTPIQVSFNGGTSWASQPAFTGMTFSLQSTQAPSITTAAGQTVAENAPFSLDVQANDPDGDPVTCSITGGADKAFFQITPGGTLSLVSPLNFEGPGDTGNDNVYEVEVTATDSFGATGVKTFSLTVTDVNEAPAIGLLSLSTGENGTSPIDLFISDPEGNALTYQIGGTDGALFDIDPVTGKVTFKSPADFENPADADKDNTYSIDVTVTDSHNASTTKTIPITILNVNEAPVFISGSVASVAEGLSGAYMADASDPEKDAVSYSLSGTDAGLFDIDAITGAVSFKALPDFEAPADQGGDNVYDIIVTADDGKGHTTTQNVAVTVTNQNDAPAITSAASANLAENGTDVLTVTASDQDPQDSLSFAVTGGADSGLFDVDSATGALTFKAPPDYENPADAGADNTYDVQVTVTDSSGSSAAQTITVTVTNLSGVTVLGTSGDDTINATTAPAGQPFPTGEEDVIIGFAGNDRLVGHKGNDLIRGGLGIDLINGGVGDDTIRGGRGKDFLFGGQGADHFIYTSVTGSSAAAGIDRIRDFTQGDDVIDLSAIDADGAGGAFRFLGSATFDGLAGALRAHAAGSDLYLEGDVNGDRIADFTLILKGGAALLLGGGDLVL